MRKTQEKIKNEREPLKSQADVEAELDKMEFSRRMRQENHERYALRTKED